MFKLICILTFFFLLSSCTSSYEILVWTIDDDKEIVNYKTKARNPYFQIMYVCLEDHLFYHHIEKVNCNYYLAEIKGEGSWIRPCCVYIKKDVKWYEILEKK